MNRRYFLAGAFSIVVSTQLPSRALGNDLRDVIKVCLKRYESDVKYYNDWMRIFQAEITKVMKEKWKSFVPLLPYTFIDIKTGEELPVKNMMYDPNFFNECNFLGRIGDYDSSGFGLSFRDKQKGDVYVRYHNQTKTFTITEQDTTYKVSDENAI